MTYASPEFVVPLRRRVGPLIVFILVLLFGVWFTVVLLGEQQAWTADPGAWAYLTTDLWAAAAIGVFALASLYYLFLLVRKEIPAKVYVTGGDEGAPASFLQPGGKPGEPVKADAEHPAPKA